MLDARSTIPVVSGRVALTCSAARQHAHLTQGKTP
jgi:hypothetical protein